MDTEGGSVPREAGHPSKQELSKERSYEVILELGVRKDGKGDKCDHSSYDIQEICRKVKENMKKSFPSSVSQSWLEPFSRMLENHRVEWKKVRLGLSASDGVCNTEGQIVGLASKSTLKQLVNFFSSPDGLDQPPALPFCLWLDKRFVGPQNHPILSDCLTHCSPRLTSLTLEIPTNVRMLIMTSKFHLNLPCLLKLSIHWSKRLTQKTGKNVEGNVTKDLSRCVVQSVLNGTEKLTHFKVTCDKDSRFQIGLIPVMPLQNLRLPTTLTTMDILGQHLNLIVHNELPHLKFLTMNLQRDLSPPRIRLASECLEKIRKTLEILKLKDDNDFSIPTAFFTRVELPIMEKLKDLKVDSCHSSFITHLSGLEKCMPVLTTITMNVSLRVWLDWLGHSKKFKTVKSLQLTLYKSEVPDVGCRINQNANQVRMMCAAFPNLHILEAAMTPEGLPILFRESQQLRKLTVVDYGRVACDRWTVAFLGITRETHDGLLRWEKFPSKSRWTNIELKREEGAVSILNLTELTSFELEGRGTFSGGKSFEAHIIFYLGFMKMPNLSNLEFNECSFKPSPKMIKKWAEEHHGKIKYTSFEHAIDKHVVCDEDDAYASAGEEDDAVSFSSDSGQDSTSSDSEDAVVDSCNDEDSTSSEEEDIQLLCYECGVLLCD